jgi:hypothetical protein
MKINNTPEQRQLHITFREITARIAYLEDTFNDALLITNELDKYFDPYKSNVSKEDIEVLGKLLHQIENLETKVIESRSDLVKIYEDMATRSKEDPRKFVALQMRPPMLKDKK